jgi:ABC-2 type transport system permease protein
MRIDLGIRARITAPVRPGGSPATVVAALSARKAARSGVLWGYIFGIAIASSEISYTRIYKTPTQRDALAATYGSNMAMSALFGPARQLQTVGGFTAFKVSMTLLILGAVWGLLTSTRLLRGEEDSGRWDLLVTGRTTRRGATAQAIAGLGAGAVMLWAVTAVIAVISGVASTNVTLSISASLYFALAMVATAVMFLAVGAVTSQLAATRRQAASFGAAFLGGSYALRLIADAGVGLHALIWVSPLGWAEELQPLTSPRPLALLPIVAFTVVLVAVAVHLADGRDVGESIVPDPAHSEAHLDLLFGPTGLAIRLMRATVIGWWVAIGVSAFLYGVVARSAGATISGSVEEVFSRLGAIGTGADAVLGVCFLIEAILIAFVAGSQVTAARSEESGGMLDHFLTRPVSRTSWLGGRFLVAIAVLVLSGVGAGVFAWLGAAIQHTGLSFTTLAGAGVNLVPPAIVILGVGVLTLGIRPRATSIVVYGVLVWSLLLVIVGGIGAVNHWVLDTSVFHHMASAPAVRPDWEANGIMTAVGMASALAGGSAFRRRDLQGA